ncbi:hypothetical protein [Achromobacter deleyi]|uniref:hypothetical protein n=1 Tax=Achromobacter deleyi TaxID=1353891 RepID=UPI001491DBA2|nr:hypothetical protein [Achromobacter deleyi]QVQ28307.1 hypothetical protein HLG70_07810 [Achromobacter deleyi]
MKNVANAMSVPSWTIGSDIAANHRKAPPKQSLFVRCGGLPHWMVAFSVAGQNDIVNVVTYARDERGAVSAAKRALTGMKHTVLWAFETLDREKVQDLLSAAILRERDAARGRDAADEARARIDVVRFRRELTVLEQSRVV